MSDTDTIVFEGPDGRLYEIPFTDAARYAVPGTRVADLRRRAHEGPPGGAAPAPSGHLRPGDTLPPGVPPPPAVGHTGVEALGAPSATTTISTPSGGTVVLNFYFGPPGPGGVAVNGPGVSSDAGVEGYHMVLDANGIPSNHLEMLWGDYIDKHGSPAVGWHSHDPVHGNAQ